ncbi:MAG: DUF3368 domain-containing protein [Chloroflexi bacterium]|nr:DUF3368 domain-containing protein [Chloroflexota bacterium]
MSERWVVNASPLILLAKVNHLDLLDQLSPSFVVPNAVVTEILAGPPDDPARRFLETTPVNTVAVSPHPLVAGWDLGMGETAVLSHALNNPPYKAIVDDGAARRCARTLAIPLAGTLAIIVAAKQKQLIPAAAPVLQTLLSHGFRIQESVLRRVLREAVGETWP